MDEMVALAWCWLPMVDHPDGEQMEEKVQVQCSAMKVAMISNRGQEISLSQRIRLSKGQLHIEETQIWWASLRQNGLSET